MISSMLAAMVFGGALAASGHDALAAGPEGLWTASDGESQIRITSCGAKLCGALAWLKDANDSSGLPLRDMKNIDPALRARPLAGLPLLLGLARAGADWRGPIYNPEDGKTYEATLTLVDADKLQIRGCVAAIFCQTEVFARAK